MRSGAKGQSRRSGLTNDLRSLDTALRVQRVFIKFAALTLLSVGLLACGGGGGGGSGGGSGGGGTPADPRIDRLDAYAAQSLRVFGDASTGTPGMPMTASDAMPTSGSAMFEGYATIRIERPGDPLALFGDAILNVDFQTGATDGALSDFFGATLTGSLTNYTGTILLEGVDAVQGGAIAYAGDLMTATDGLVFDGLLTATYLSDPVAAFVASDLEATISDNGVMQDGSLIVVGEGSVVAPAVPP